MNRLAIYTGVLLGASFLGLLGHSYFPGWSWLALLSIALVNTLIFLGRISILDIKKEAK